MTAPTRLAAFAAVLAAVGGGAALVGASVDPVHDGAAGHPGDGHGGAAVHAPAAGHAADAPRGLAVSAGGYTLAAERTSFPRGRVAELAFRIEDAEGEAVRSFDVGHERRMHLIVVRRDMVLYQHLHPRMDADGTWRVPLRLAEGGVHRAYADFEVDGEKHTLATDLTAAGEFTPEALPPARPVGAVGAYEVTLSSPTLREGREARLSFHARLSGQGARLQPYLGARGHLVALRDGDLAYLHVHPVEAEDARGRVAFATTFPSAGRYRLFLQTRHGGRVRTVAHTVEVTR